jgi:4-hydroxybenzoate polyprenyltransferase
MKTDEDKKLAEALAQEMELAGRGITDVVDRHADPARRTERKRRLARKGLRAAK